MTNKLNFSPLDVNHITEMVAAFSAIGWNKPRSIYDVYLAEQAKGTRSIIIAKSDDVFCGYVTIKWQSEYPNFNQQNIPEIVDLNVLPAYRNKGIATRLVKACEAMVSEKGCKVIGIGVGLTADYGNAQRLYIQLGFIPDRQGLHYHHNTIKYGHQVQVDDDLVLYFTKPISSDNDEVTFDLPTHIATPRLLLRPPQTGDGKILNDAILDSFELLHKYMLWAKEKPSLDESEAVVTRESRNWIYPTKSDPELMLLIFDKNTNDLIGATGFHGIDWDVPCAETGYWIRKKYSGLGFMTEAINALTQYAFNVMKVRRLAITCDADNERSKKLAERLGYRFESLMKANRIKPISGDVTDTLAFVRNDLTDLPELEVTWSRIE